MKSRPTQIERLPSAIEVQWVDGHRSEYSRKLLRQKYPCTRCEAFRLDKIRYGYCCVRLFEKLNLMDIQFAGRYAHCLTWGDGHRTGIYLPALSSTRRFSSLTPKR